MKPRIAQKIIAIVCLLLLAGTFSSKAQSSVFTNGASGLWGDALMWNNNIIANGVGATAGFTNQDLFGNIVVSLDAPRTIGNMFFDDQDGTNTPAGWVIDDNVDTNNVLTLASGSGNLPVIYVANLGTNDNLFVDLPSTYPYYADIQVRLAGIQGFSKTGPGIMRILRQNGNENANIYSGTTRLRAGRLMTAGVANNGNGVGWLGTSTIQYANDGTNIGTLWMHGYDGPDSTFGGLSNNISVPFNQSGRLLIPARISAGGQGFHGSLGGAGTLYLGLPRNTTRTQLGLGADWSQFSGALVITNRANETIQFRITHIGGFQNAHVSMPGRGALVMRSDGMTNYINRTNWFGLPYLIPIGEIGATNIFSAFTDNGVGDGAANAVTWRIGAVTPANSNVVFSGNADPNGIINVTGFVKEGAGTWTLASRTWGTIGGFVISNGTLRIADAQTNLNPGTPLGALGPVGAQRTNLTSSITLSFTTNATLGGITTNVITNIMMNAVINYGTLVFARTNDITLSNIVAGTGALIQGGSGTLSLVPLGDQVGPLSINVVTNADTGGGSNILRLVILAHNHRVNGPIGNTNMYTGATIITNGGTITIVDDGGLGVPPSSPVANKLTLDNGGLGTFPGGSYALNVNRGITVGGGGAVFKPESGGTITIPGIIAGAGGLVLGKPGTLELNGANTYLGKTTVTNSGQLSVSDPAALGASPGSFTADQLTLNNGELHTSADLNFGGNRGVTLGPDGGVVDVEANKTLTFANPVAGSGGLTKMGLGTNVLSAANTYTGNTTVSNGVLRLGASGTISSSPIIKVAGGATLDALAAGLTLGNGQTLVGNGVVKGNVTANSGSAISPGFSIGAITLTNNLTMSGNVTNAMEINSTSDLDQIIVGGNLTVSGTGAGANRIKLSVNTPLGNGTYTLMKYSGTLSGGSPNLLVFGYPRTRQTAATGMDFSTANQVNFTLSGSGSTNLVWHGGTDNIWDWNNKANFTNGNGAQTFYDFDSIKFDDTSLVQDVDLVETVVPGIPVIVNSTLDYIIRGVGDIRGGTTLFKTGSAELTVLTTNASFTGPVVISNGIVNLGDSSTFGSLGSGVITNEGTLRFRAPADTTLTIPGSIRGGLAGKVINESVGTVIFTGTNIYTGGTLNDSGTLQIGTGGSIGTLGTGGVTNNAALVFNRSDNFTNFGVISGSGTLEQAGAGTNSLQAQNTYSGQTYITAGALSVGVGGGIGSIGASAVVHVGDANPATAFIINRSDNLNFNPDIVGQGSFVKQGAGIVTLTSSNNTYTGVTFIGAGGLKIGDGVTPGLGSLPNGFLTNNGTLILSVPLNPGVTNTPMTNYNRMFGNGKLVFQGPADTYLIPNGLNINDGVPNTQGIIISNNTHVWLGDRSANNNFINTLNNAALGSGTILFTNGGGTIEMAGSYTGPNTASQGQTFPNGIVIAPNTTATIYYPFRLNDAGSAIGAVLGDATATYNIRSIGVRATMGNNISNFFGRVNISAWVANEGPSGTADFRLAMAAGMPNAKVRLIRTVNTVALETNIVEDPPSVFTTNVVYTNYVYVPAFGRPGNIGAAPASPIIGELSGDKGTLLNTSDANGQTTVNWTVGRLNTTTNFDGNIDDRGGRNARLVSITKEGTGGWTLTGTNDYAGSTTVSNGVLSLIGNGSYSPRTTPINVNNGTKFEGFFTNGAASATFFRTPIVSKLNISGITDDAGVTNGTIVLGATNAQTLTGSGIVLGSVITSTTNVTDGTIGTISPGSTTAFAAPPGSDSRIGILQVTNSVVLGGDIRMDITRTNLNTYSVTNTIATLIIAGGVRVLDGNGFPTVSNIANVAITYTNNSADMLVASNSITYGGVLTVINRGGVLRAGDSFKLFSAPTISGTFALTNMPQLIPGLSWSNYLVAGANHGVVTVVGTPTASIAPMVVTNIVTGTNTLDIQWPADHIGWQLLVQTIAASAGLDTNSANWTLVAGSAFTNEVIVPIVNTRNTNCVFYRLVFYP